VQTRIHRTLRISRNRKSRVEHWPLRTCRERML
jgi:hypothetical protein